MPRIKTLKQVLADNVKALMAARKLRQQHVAAMAKMRGHNIDQTTVGRIARADIPTTVEKLAALAAGLSVEPWQLLVPNLDPANLPKLGTDLRENEKQLLTDFRRALPRWRLLMQLLIAKVEPHHQDQAAEGVSAMLSKLLSSEPKDAEVVLDRQPLLAGHEAPISDPATSRSEKIRKEK